MDNIFGMQRKDPECVVTGIWNNRRAVVNSKKDSILNVYFSPTTSYTKTKRTSFMDENMV
jgi:hypothetical protein